MTIAHATSSPVLWDSAILLADGPSGLSITSAIIPAKEECLQRPIKPLCVRGTPGV